MTSHELAHRLLEGPDLMVTVRGYEGGVNEVTSILEPMDIHLNLHDEGYYGTHEYHTGEECYFCVDKTTVLTTQAIHLSR